MKKHILLLITITFFLSIQLNAQFTEKFSNGIPSSWTVVNNSGTSVWEAETFLLFGYDDNDYVILDGTSLIHDDYLITPQINVDGVNVNRFSFYASKSILGIGNEVMHVRISTTGTLPINFSVFLDPAVQVSSVTYAKYEYDLTPFVGQNVYIAIHAVTPQASQYYFYIDEVVADFGSVSIKENESAQINHFPNPTTGKINFESDEQINSIRICDLLGKEMLIKTFNTKVVELDLSDLSEGVYVAYLAIEEETSIVKIIKE